MDLHPSALYALCAAAAAAAAASSAAHLRPASTINTHPSSTSRVSQELEWAYLREGTAKRTIVVSVISISTTKISAAHPGQIHVFKHKTQTFLIRLASINHPQLLPTLTKYFFFCPQCAQIHVYM